MTPTYPQLLPDRDKWRNWYVDEDIKVTLTNNDTLYIRKGYRFDAHSVPFIFRWVFPKYNKKDIYAALVHDYILDTQPWHRYTRRFADEQYTHYMRNLNYSDSAARSKWMPRAVKLAGYVQHLFKKDYRGDPCIRGY